MTSSEVLAAYGLPALGDIPDAAFRGRFGLNRAGQYGIACRNAGAEWRAAESLGAGPFFPITMAAPNWTERGERRRCKLEIALGYVAEAQLEFLGPGEGTAFYADALQGRSHVLHHVGVFQNNTSELEQRLNRAGFDTVVEGGVGLGSRFGFRFKYIDTRDAIGCYLELLDFHLFYRAISIERPVRLLARLRQGLTG